MKIGFCLIKESGGSTGSEARVCLPTLLSRNLCPYIFGRTLFSEREGVHGIYIGLQSRSKFQRLNLVPIETCDVAERQTHTFQDRCCYSTSAGARSTGFRLDPAEQLERIHQELSSLHQVHAADPILGVDFEEEESVS